MKRMLALVLSALLCTGCSALPGEDRSFAVALGVSENGGVWEVSARIPAYQTSGGYLTISARGNSIGEALALLNASAPMELHYGQLRMMLFSKDLAQSSAFAELLRAISARGEVREQAALCVTEDSVLDVMDALEPATGSRLSKSLESLLAARRQLGVLPEAALSSLRRMGERQQGVLIAAALESTADDTVPGMDASAGDQAAKGAGKIQFSGGWLLGMDGQVHGSLTAMDMQLLSLLQGTLRQGTLSLPEGTLTLLDADSSINLEGQTVHCRIKLRYSAATFTQEGVQQALISSLQGLSGKLAAAGCDALGLGRQAMLGCADMAQWHALDWRSLYPALEWRFTVEAEREA